MQHSQITIAKQRTVGQWLAVPVSIAPLVVLRMAFGLLMLISTVRFIAFGWVDTHFVDPVMHFTYPGFGWVMPLGRIGMYTIHIVMLLACIGIILGAWYRGAALTFALLFTYCELIDLTYYLNHYYFVSLFSFLMALVPAGRAFSFDSYRRPDLTCSHVPRWTIALLMLQIGIVYTYAGLAKINTIWLLEALPLKIWLPAHSHLPLIGWLMKYEATAYVFSWFGMLYDTFIVWGLLWKRTRTLAYATVIVFHLMTGILFQVGMFPYVMIALTLLFFSEKWHEGLLKGLAWGMRTPAMWPPVKHTYAFSSISLRILKPVLLIYCLLQLMLPWRYLLYPGNLFWHETGYRFSWRVMLMEKAGTATFYVQDRATGREGVVDNRDFLNPHQEKQMAFQPDFILQYAHFLANYYAGQGLTDPRIRAEVYVTLNGQLSRLMIDPERDLTTLEDGWWQPRRWVLEE